MKTKRWMLIVVACCIGLLPLAGCDETKTVDGNQVKAAAAKLDALSQRLDEYQVQAKTDANALSAAGIVDPAAKAKVEKINAEIDKVQMQIKQITQALQSQDYSQDSSGIATMIAAAQAANRATAAFNPYSPVIDGVLALLSILLILFAKKKTTALNEVVMGNETFKLMASAEAVEKMKTCQAANQSEATTKQVKAITA